MPKILHCPTRIDMAAEDYHALRMDQKFDAFCATQTRSKFSLQSRSSSHEEQKGHVIEHMECLLAYEENPIPVAFHKMLGAPLSRVPGATPPPNTPRPLAGTAGTKDFAFKYQSRWRARLARVRPASPAAMVPGPQGGRGAARSHRLGQPCHSGWAAAAAAESSPDDALTTPRVAPHTQPAPSLTITRDREKFDEAHACTFSSEPPACNYVDTYAVPHVRVPASCVLCVPEAQGSLPREGAQYERCAVRQPASGVPYVPRTVAPQVFKVRVRVRVSQSVSHYHTPTNEAHGPHIHSPTVGRLENFTPKRVYLHTSFYV